MDIKLEKLIYALTQRIKKDIIAADYQTVPLQGGTVGNVYLVSGTAETAEGEILSYRIVLEI